MASLDTGDIGSLVQSSGDLGVTFDVGAPSSAVTSGAWAGCAASSLTGVPPVLLRTLSSRKPRCFRHAAALKGNQRKTLFWTSSVSTDPLKPSKAGITSAMIVAARRILRRILMRMGNIIGGLFLVSRKLARKSLGNPKSSWVRRHLSVDGALGAFLYCPQRLRVRIARHLALGMRRW